jgi:hypothetical protein
MYYKLIYILYALLCGQNFILVKSGCYTAQAKQLAAGSSTHDQSVEGPSEGSYTMDGPHQLHHCGGDSHRRRSAAGTFFLNECLIIILFDSGASHDFMSFTYAKKRKVITCGLRSAIHD